MKLVTIYILLLCFPSVYLAPTFATEQPSKELLIRVSQSSTIKGWVMYQGNWYGIQLNFEFENGRAVLVYSKMDGMQGRNEYRNRSVRLNSQHEMAVKNNMTHYVSTQFGTAYFNEANAINSNY